MLTATGAGVPDQIAETWNVTLEPAWTDRPVGAESTKSAADGGGGGVVVEDEEVLAPQPERRAKAASTIGVNRRKLVFM